MAFSYKIVHRVDFERQPGDNPVHLGVLSAGLFQPRYVRNVRAGIFRLP